MKKLLMHPLISTILGGVVATVIATPIVAYFNTIKWTEALSLICVTVTNCISLILNFDIKLWWILAAIMVFVLVVYLLVRFIPPSSTSQDSFLNYKTDTIEGIVWQWRWRYNDYKGSYNITNLRPICYSCKADIVQYEGYYQSENRVKCVICGFEKQVNNLDAFLEKIDIEINRRVRTDEYKKKIEAS
ncbi:hypothetical protein EEL31_23790 [Brevibacillus laterosporus]|nr:hypothetical protein [Brevibacillus laterosporus]TPG71154.1 hypothetical protein EEL31_23790 [Brevibacillus laterosporus]